VGAVTPGRNFCRLGFSNYCVDCEDPHRVHISAWGEGVATLGYGNLFMPDGNRMRSYTHSFNGTSAATPQIAALVACSQGLAKMMFGIPLTPVQIRDIVSNNGWFQCAYQNINDHPGVNGNFACFGDFS